VNRVARKNIIAMFLVALAVVLGDFQVVQGTVHQADDVNTTLGFFGGH
jgi:hypothetical protein